jgi:hypothetical protein
MSDMQMAQSMRTAMSMINLTCAIEILPVATGPVHFVG